MTDERYNQRYEAGMKVRRAVLGDSYVDQAEANKTTLDTDFQALVTETAWGAVWSRPHLDRRTRHLLTISLLAALGHERELALHLRAIHNTGVSPDDVAEALLQVAVYAGIPAANSAFAIAKKVFAELSETEDREAKK